MALVFANPAARAAGQALLASYVLFVNSTQRNVNLYWIDYQGKPTLYFTLRPQATAKVNTYRSHPWVFRDQYSGERMQVAHQYTFWPQPYVMRDPRNLHHWIPCRKQVLIHFPVRSLRDNCMWHVVTKVLGVGANTSTVESNTVNASEAIERLCIPHTLKSDLMIVLNSVVKETS